MIWIGIAIGIVVGALIVLYLIVRAFSPDC
jgi:hypothetical protein